MERRRFLLMLAASYAVALSSPMALIVPSLTGIDTFRIFPLLIILWIALVVGGFIRFRRKALWMLPGALFTFLPFEMVRSL